MKIKELFTAIFFAFSYLAILAVAYNLLQKPAVYERFSSFMSTYEQKDNNIVSVKKPFTGISEKSLTENMDAYHYSYIKKNLYNYSDTDDSRFNFAFFPLFPLVWKFSCLPGKGIVVLNFLLHLISALILCYIFCRNYIVLSIIVIFSLPTLTVFIIPYTEALFMFLISIALLGWKKKLPLLYIAGLSLACMTRPVFAILISGIVATELYFFLLNRRKVEYRHLTISIVAIGGGTLFIALIQKMYHHGSLFTFISSQRHWGTYLRIPAAINDWSGEGYAMNVWAMGFCMVVGSISLLYRLFRKSDLVSSDPFDYWYYFSWFYLLFATISVLLLQGGCLHSLYRYTLCTPFFYIIIFQHLNTYSEAQKINIQAISVFIIFIVACILFFTKVDYSKQWDFTKTGFILLSLNLLFFILMRKLNITQKYIGYVLLLLPGIIWNCYLLNMFITRAWIFL